MGLRQIGCIRGLAVQVFSMFFDLWIADVDVAPEEAKSRIGLGCDVVDMLVPLSQRKS